MDEENSSSTSQNEVQEEKSSSRKFIWGVAVVILLVALGFVLFSGSPSGTGNATNSNTGTKLSASPYASYAYLIYPGQPSASAQKAMTGVKLEATNNSDGTTTVRLIAISPMYQNQTYTLHQGDSLYFLERSLVDDSDGTEHFTADDTALVVNSQGYIIAGPESA